jgi:hypothetical protein
MKRERVVFYSKKDLAAEHHLLLAERVLEAFDENAVYEDVNDVLELASIRLYIKNEMFLRSWDDERINRYKNTIDKFPSIISRFIAPWLGKKFVSEYDFIEYGYRSIFWESVADFGIFKSLSNGDFAEWLKTHGSELHDILLHEKIVNRFSAELISVIKNSKIATELLIEHALFKPKKTVYWPKALSDSDKREMVKAYMGSDCFNVNYLKKIQNASRNAEPKIDEELRLMAKEAYEKWFARQITLRRVGVQVSFLPSMDVPIRYTEENQLMLVECSSEWVKTHLDFQSISLMLKTGFRFTDNDGRSTLPFYKKDRLLFVDMGVPTDNKEVYPKDCFAMVLRDLLYGALLDSYRSELWKNGLYFEDIFKCFFEKWLPLAYGVKDFSFDPPSIQTTNLEKIKIILPEIERILKIYKMFQEGNVNSNLLNTFSSPVSNWDELKSLLGRKHVYPAKEGYAVFNILFSQHLSVYCLLKTSGEKYKNFYERLQSEKVSYDIFDSQCRELLQYLIDVDCISVKEGLVEYNKTKCELLKDIYDNDVLNTLPLNSEERQCIDELIAKSVIVASDSLFSTNEQNYISFVWSDSYKNGLAIRNRYLHGAYSPNDPQIHRDYIEILKLLVMIMISLDDEFRYCHRMN